MIVLKVLTRYARSQFLSPFEDKPPKESNGAYPSKKEKKAKKKAFYSDDENGEKKEKSDLEESDSDDGKAPVATELDKDHALLIKQASLLVQSRNAGVILELVALFFCLAPLEECHKVVKPMMRMVRNRREVSYVLLANASTLSAKQPDLFRPYLKDFFY